jgi:ketosteroid isomerase-like protein
MPAYTPEEVHRLWAEAFSAHDLEAVMALYEPEATLIPPGQEVPNLILTGAEAVREHLSGLLALKLTVSDRGSPVSSAGAPQ